MGPINPMMILKQYMSKGMTPKGIITNLAKNNPILNNVMNMAQNGDSKGVENFARNICKQRGVDFDTEFGKFKDGFK